MCELVLIVYVYFINSATYSLILLNEKYKYTPWNENIIALGEYETNFCVLKDRKYNECVNNTLCVTKI
jgi:hypothetical protein